VDNMEASESVPKEASKSVVEDMEAVRVYHGFTEHTHRLIFPFEDKFAPETPHLFTIVPSGVVENNKVLEPQKEKGLIAFAYPQSISDAFAELPVGQQPVSKVDSSTAEAENNQVLSDTAFVWRREDGTNALVQTWPINLNEKFRQDFEISEGVDPDSAKFLPQAVSEFQEAMVQLFGPDAVSCPILFCHKQLANTSPAVVGLGEEVLAHLKEHPDLMRELAIASIDSDSLGFMADGTNGTGQKFEKHFRLTPGEQCVVYRKTGWDTMGCIKPLHQFLHDAEFHEPPTVEEPVGVEKNVAATIVEEAVRAPPPSPTNASGASAKTKVSAKCEDLKRPCPTPARTRSPLTCSPPSSEKGRTPRKSGPAIQVSPSNANGGNVGSLRPRTPTARPTQQRKSSPPSTRNAGSVNNANHKVHSTAELEEVEIAEKRRQMKLIAERNARHMTRMSAARIAVAGSTEETAKDRSPRSPGASHRHDVKLCAASQERRSSSVTKASCGAGTGGVSNGGTTPSSRMQQGKPVMQKRPTASGPTGSTATSQKSLHGEPAPNGAASGVSTSTPGKRGGAVVTAPSTCPGKATEEAAAMPGKATPSRPQSRPRTPTAKRDQVAAAMAVFTRRCHGTKNLQLGPATRPAAERRSPSVQKAKVVPDRAVATAAAVATVQATTANIGDSA